MEHKNLLIFGASGSTGHELVKQSLALGHRVTAFVRNPVKLSIRHDHLTTVTGNVKDYRSVEGAVTQQDAVICALGVSRPLRKDPDVVEGVRNIVRSMEMKGVRRLIYLSTNAVEENRKDAGFLIRHIVYRIVHNEIEDHEQKEQIIRSSRLDWTIVRAPALTNGPHTGTFRSGPGIKPNSILPKLSRADVADFMIRQLTKMEFIHKSPTVLH